jgi:small subunit ribosomal protein S11
MPKTDVPQNQEPKLDLEKTQEVAAVSAVSKETPSAAPVVAPKVKKSNKKSLPKGIIFIQASMNNVIVTLTDLKGNTLGWMSSGASEFKGSRKSTPHAAQETVRKLMEKTRDLLGLKEVNIIVKGAGSAREAAIRAVSTYVRVTEIKDRTGIPHNGCRPPKRRRV